MSTRRATSRDSILTSRNVRDDDGDRNLGGFLEQKIQFYAWARPGHSHRQGSVGPLLFA
jgi:hypothetical protein